MRAWFSRIWGMIALAIFLSACADVTLRGDAGGLDAIEAGPSLDSNPGDTVAVVDVSPGGCRTTADCFGGNFCASARTCREGRCVVLGGVPNCDDGISCTVDRCDPTQGACLHDPTDSLCPMDRVCDPANGCITPPSCEVGDTTCQRLNHDTCRGTWSCDAVTLHCTRSAPVDCDDHGDCTIDGCVNEGATHHCTHDMRPNDCGGRMCGPSPSGCYTCEPGCVSGTCVDGHCIGCGPCEMFAGDHCVPAPDGTTCSDDRDMCTRDVCLAMRCDHSQRIANDCDTRDCGRSPTGCFTCGAMGGACPSGLFCQMGHCAQCPDCQGWNGTACVALADDAACTDDRDRCTRDVCVRGACTHPPAPLKN